MNPEIKKKQPNDPDYYQWKNYTTSYILDLKKLRIEKALRHIQFQGFQLFGTRIPHNSILEHLERLIPFYSFSSFIPPKTQTEKQPENSGGVCARD